MSKKNEVSMLHDSPPQGRKVSRREFGNIVTKYIVSGLTSYALWKTFFGPSLEGRIEREPIKDNALPFVIDFIGVNFSTVNATLAQRVDNETIIKSLAGIDYQTEFDMGIQAGFEALSESKDFITAALDKNPKMALIRGFWRQYSNHGLFVVQTIHDVWAERKREGKPVVYPLQVIISDVQLTQDSAENYGIDASIDPDRIKTLLMIYPDQKIINMSFLVGKTGFKMCVNERIQDRGQFDPIISEFGIDGKNFFILEDIQTNSITTRPYKDEQGQWKVSATTDSGHEFPVFDNREAAQKAYNTYLEEHPKKYTIIPLDYPDVALFESYAREGGDKYLEQLFQIAQEFPDRLFIAAAGNSGSIVDSLRILQQKGWTLPNNLLLVGEAVRVHFMEKVGGKAYDLGLLGAELYIDPSQFGKEMGGSSQSTAIISALCSYLLDRGVPLQEIKEKIMAATQKVEEELHNFRLFDQGLFDSQVGKQYSRRAMFTFPSSNRDL